MEFGSRADCFALVYDGLSGFFVATDNDNPQTRSIIAMGFAEFADCEFANSIFCAYEDCGKWLCFDESGISGGDGCEFDHCGEIKDVKKVLVKKMLAEEKLVKKA